MKRNRIYSNLFVISIIITGNCVFAQNNAGAITVTEISNSSSNVNSSENTGGSNVIDTAYYLMKISNIQNHLDAIETKKAYINSNPEEKAIAENEGWFEKMEETKKHLLLQKKELEDKIK